MEAPEHLFWHIEQCQEIQVIADNPYTPMQLMTNAVQLLMSSGIFPPREFEDWKATANKAYASLKVFVHGAYARRLVTVQLCTTGQQGYVANHNNNMFQVLEDGASATNDEASVATITNQTAANVTMGSTLRNTYEASLAPTNPSLSPQQEYAAATTAINQLTANQTEMWSHIQNMSLHDSAPPTHIANPVVYNPSNAEGHPAPYQAPPIHLLTIPAPYQAGSFNQGQGGRVMGGRTHHCLGCAGPSPNPFGAAGRGANQVVFVHGGGVRPPQGQYSPAKATVPRDNTPTLIKKYNNWNVCYTCSFDVKAKLTW
jgi:hypothetical protein